MIALSVIASSEGRLNGTPDTDSRLQTQPSAFHAAGGSSHHIEGTPVQARTVSTTEPMEYDEAMKEWVSPDNDEFTDHLQRNGDLIFRELSGELATSPVDRTRPMVGMGKLIKQVETLVTKTINSNPIVTDADKQVYIQLVQDLKAVAAKDCPWNEAFILAYKAAHLISFYHHHYYYHHQGVNTNTHRSWYKPNATLEQLNRLPWHDALANPSRFETELEKIWHSHHLKFPTVNGELKPLGLLSKYCFPCLDELDLAFFNRTMMLGILPLGFFTEATIRFDGADGLCADFFEHDILHSAYIPKPAPELFVPANVLMDQAKDGCQIICRIPDQKVRADYPAKIAKEALELLMFEITHERNQSWTNTSPDFFDKMVDNLLADPSCSSSKLRYGYDNLDERYTEIKKWQLQYAALLLQKLANSQFWQSESPEQAKRVLQQAMTQATFLSKDSPVIKEVRQYLENCEQQVSAELPDIRKFGIIPFVELTKEQLDSYYSTLPFGHGQTPDPEYIPLATFFAHPEWMTSKHVISVKNYLVKYNTDPAAQALIGSISTPENLRQLLKNHTFSDSHRLRCFDGISFTPLSLENLDLSDFSFRGATLDGFNLEGAQLYPEIRKFGLIPFVELTKEQLDSYYSTLPFGHGQTPDPEYIPLATFFAHPEWMTSKHVISVKNYLVKYNTDPAAQALIGSISTPENLRQLLKNNTISDSHRLRCFDGISFTPLSLENLNLSDFSFREATLDGFNLTGAELYFCDFFKASMRNVEMKKAEIHHVQFGSADMRDSDLSQMMIHIISNTSRGITTKATSFESANMNGCNLDATTPNHIPYDLSSYREYAERSTTSFDWTCLDNARLSLYEGGAKGQLLATFSGASLRDINLPAYNFSALAHCLLPERPMENPSFQDQLNHCLLLKETGSDPEVACEILATLSQAATAEEHTAGGLYEYLCQHYKVSCETGNS